MEESIIDYDKNIFVVALHLISFAGKLFEIFITGAQLVKTSPTLINNLLIMIDTTAQLRNLSAVTKALNETVLVNKYHLEYQCTGDVDNQRYTT